MKFDAIIIGGGLSGLTAGIALAQAGRDVAVVSNGQSTLHFNGGTLDLLGCDEVGNVVRHPLEAIASLNDKHPYKKVADVKALAEKAQQLLDGAGIDTEGSAEQNHWRITPIGGMKPAWLSLKGMATIDDPDHMPWKRVMVVNIVNYLDFLSPFVAEALRERGVEVEVKAFSIPELDEARKSPSEMRATNIAKVVERQELTETIAEAINHCLDKDCDVVLLPAVLGISNGQRGEQLLGLIDTPAAFVATLPPSVPGVRMQTLLRKRFQQLGGTFIVGDQVTGGRFEGDKLKSVTTAKLEGSVLEAENFVLATGSFMSRGLVADYIHIYEPALGVDVDDNGLDRATWAALEVTDAQPYMEVGVKTDAQFKCCKDGATIANLYAAGSILSGHNGIKRIDATGVDMITALQVANNILNS